jgi:LPS sulfotransferase NodH
LGVAPPEVGTIRPPLAKLSDDISLDWISRYTRDLLAAR